MVKLFTMEDTTLLQDLENVQKLMAEKQDEAKEKFCSLCHRNGESEMIYRSHCLKDPKGRVVTCPVLRKFTRTLCGAAGDGAHTLRYCPLNKDGAYNSGASLADLKKRRNAAGNSPRVEAGRMVMVCHPLPAHLRRQVEDPVTARIR